MTVRQRVRFKFVAQKYGCEKLESDDLFALNWKVHGN